jgi:thiol:disulfide interchange protein DsbC
MKKNYSIIVVLALILVPFLSVTSHAFAPKKGDKDCRECHKLDKKEAEAIVKKIAPTGTVTDIKDSPIKGVWQIEVDAGEGKHGALFLDYAKKFLIAQIVPVENLGKQQGPPKKVDVSKIHLNDAITVGAKDAAKKVIVFSDPDCPFCKQLHKTIQQIIAKRPDIAFVELLYPLPMHPNAPKKVQAILCSKSLQLLEQYFEADDKTVAAEPPANCTTEGMERNKALAQSLGLNSTPTMVRDDGSVLAGALPEDKLLEWIDKKQ